MKKKFPNEVSTQKHDFKRPISTVMCFYDQDKINEITSDDSMAETDF